MNRRHSKFNTWRHSRLLPPVRMVDRVASKPPRRTIKKPPRRTTLNFCWQASQTVTSALVSSRRNGRSRQFISVFYNEFGTFSGQSLPGPPQASCLPDVSKMSPRCLPEVSQVSLRCLPDVSQMSPRCLSDVSQMSPRCLSDVFQMSLKCVPALGIS